MFFHRRFLISVCIFVSAVILCGAVEIIFTSKPAFNCITQCVCIVFMLFWTNSIKKRIIDPVRRRLLLACGYLLLSYFAFEIIKYKFLNINLLWYFYYVPMTLVPLLAFFVAFENYGRQLERRRYIYPLIALPSVIILFLILTNDCHNLAFEISDGNSYTYGPVYFAHIIWSVLLLIGVLYFSIKGFYVSSNKKFGFILVLPMAFELVYTMLYATGNNPEILGCHIWSTGVVFAATCVGILEMCIQLGLIPSNSGYEKIYGILKIPSGIFEKSGVCVYSSANFEKIELPSENYHCTQSEISGGFVKTAVDISAVNQLNQKLSIISKQLQRRNEHLISENRTRKEKAEIEERSRIYDNVALAVMPQLERIKELLDGDFDKNIGEIAILNAYIKRRSNMELLAAVDDRISSSEIFNALLESSEYIELSGKNVVFTYNGEGCFPAQMIIEAYIWFENILEGCMQNLRAIAINAQVLNGDLCLRLVISAENFHFTTVPEGLRLEKYIKKSQLTKAGDDIIITMHLREDGGGK